MGNKYYEDKNGKRWVIYKRDEIDATKIPQEWFSWIHYTKIKLKTPQLNKYDWQVDHKPNATGTSDAYKPNKIKMLSKIFNLEGLKF